MYEGITIVSTDPITVVSWWESTPNANIGVATGGKSGLVVVDPDGVVGLSNWRHLLDLHGSIETRRVISGREDGGEHWYFRIPAGSEGWLKSDANILAEGVDTRADGGYIVAPPSVHPTGATYEWVDARVPITSLPEWIHSIIHSQRPPAQPEQEYAIVVNDPDVELRSFTEGTAYGRKVLEDESKRLADTPEGGRDRAAYDAYRRIGRLVGSRHLSAEKALRSLRWALDKNGLGRAGEKLQAFQDGLNHGIREPVRPDLVNPRAAEADAHEDPDLDNASLSEFLWLRTESNQRNSDIPERLPPLPPLCSVAGGPPADAFGSYSDLLSLDQVLALTERDMKCSFTASLVLTDSKKDLFVGRRRCHRRACRGCLYHDLREHLERLTDAVAIKPGTWWCKRIPAGGWGTLNRALLRDNLDFARVPLAAAFLVFVFGPDLPRHGFDPVGGERQFQALFVEAYQQLPPADINSAQVTFSKAWTRPHAEGKANLRRVGITAHEAAMRRAASYEGADIQHAFDDFDKIITNGNDATTDAVLEAGRLAIGKRSHSSTDAGEGSPTSAT